MKSTIIILSFVAFVTSSVIVPQSDIDAEWEAFKRNYNKVFIRSLMEEAYRKSIFSKTYADIKEHNERFAAGLETYDMGINQFSDMTYEEFAEKYLEKDVSALPFENVSEGLLKRTQSPENHSWYTPEIPVKDQGTCGSCWAFAAVGSIEYQYKIKYNITRRLSEQELLDCVSPDYGCKGGQPSDALKYVKENGIQNANLYEYKNVKGECLADKELRPRKVIKDVQHTSSNEESYKDHLFQHGPSIVIFYADEEFKNYRSGIFQNKACNVPNKHINHAVLLIGYGSDNGSDYWFIRNSWSAEWGIGGHFKIARNQNMCNLGVWPAYYPVFYDHIP